MFEKISIIGCGLIGSSILRNINNNNISKSVTIFDKSKDVVETIKKKIYVITSQKIFNLQLKTQI